MLRPLQKNARISQRDAVSNAGNDLTFVDLRPKLRPSGMGKTLTAFQPSFPKFDTAHGNRESPCDSDLHSPSAPPPAVPHLGDTEREVFVWRLYVRCYKGLRLFTIHSGSRTNPSGITTLRVGTF